MFYIIFILAIVIDIVTKIVAKIYLTHKISLIGDAIFLKYIQNPGIAFGIPVWGIALKLMTIVFIGFIAYYYFKEEKQKHSLLIDISFGLILAGAIGNGIERLFRGSVIDFIGIQYFAVCNIADVSICIGAILYIYNVYRKN